MKSLILALMIAAGLFAGCSVSAEYSEKRSYGPHSSTHSPATSNTNYSDVFMMKLKAAEAISLNTPERDKALSTVAIDAAKSVKDSDQPNANRSAIALRGLKGIASKKVKDRAAATVAEILGQSRCSRGDFGKESSNARKDALAAANMIEDRELRDKTLMKIASQATK